MALLLLLAPLAVPAARVSAQQSVTAPSHFVKPTHTYGMCHTKLDPTHGS